MDTKVQKGALVRALHEIRCSGHGPDWVAPEGTYGIVYENTYPEGAAFAYGVWWLTSGWPRNAGFCGIEVNRDEFEVIVPKFSIVPG